MESQEELLDWKSLSFGYLPTDYNVRCYWRDGAWGEWEVSSSDMITIPMAATCLHYGQESFEGLKAFRGRDGKVRVFRPEENAQRMQQTSRGILMPELPTERFLEAIDMMLRLNKRFIPSTDDRTREASRGQARQRVYVPHVCYPSGGLLQGGLPSNPHGDHAGL